VSVTDRLILSLLVDLNVDINTKAKFRTYVLHTGQDVFIENCQTLGRVRMALS